MKTEIRIIAEMTDEQCEVLTSELINTSEIIGIKLEVESSKLSQHDVILSLPSLDKIIQSRVKDKFSDGYHNFERTELLDALDTIKRLVPPSYFEGNGI